MDPPPRLTICLAGCRPRPPHPGQLSITYPSDWPPVPHCPPCPGTFKPPVQPPHNWQMPTWISSWLEIETEEELWGCRPQRVVKEQGRRPAPKWGECEWHCSSSSQRYLTHTAAQIVPISESIPRIPTLHIGLCTSCIASLHHSEERRWPQTCHPPMPTFQSKGAGAAGHHSAASIIRAQNLVADNLHWSRSCTPQLLDLEIE